MRLIFVTLCASLAIVSCSLIWGTCETTNKANELAKLDQDLSSLEQNFQATVKDLFREKQTLADELIKSTDAIEGHAIKAISARATLIEIIKYVVRRKALLASKSSIEQHFTDDTNGRLFKQNGKFHSSLISALIQRATLRSIIDGFEYTEDHWKVLYKYLENYVNTNASEQLKSLAENIFKRLELARDESVEAYERQGQQLASFLKDSFYGASKGSDVIKQLDREIDLGMGCQRCADVNEPEEELYDTYSMFESESDVNGLVRELVDNELLHEVSNAEASVAGKIVHLDANAVEGVDLGEIDELRKAILGH